MALKPIEQDIEDDRLVCAIGGQPKDGKTHFCTTFPAPLYVFDFDLGFQHHEPRLIKDGVEVYRGTYRTPGLHPDLADAEAALESFENDFMSIVGNDEGTIIMDSGTQFWQLVQYVFLEPIRRRRTDEKIFPFDYKDPNKYYADFINMVKDESKLNFVMTLKMQAKYNDSGAPTGRYELHGNKDTTYLVGTVLYAKRKKEGDNTLHGFTITDSWQAPQAEGVELWEPNATYDGLMKIIKAMR